MNANLTRMRRKPRRKAYLLAPGDGSMLPGKMSLAGLDDSSRQRGKLCKQDWSSTRVIIVLCEGAVFRYHTSTPHIMTTRSISKI